MSNIEISVVDQQIVIKSDDLTNAARIAAQQAASEADVSAAVALAAAGPNYADTAAGLAATSEGDTFAVDEGDTIAVYRHDAGPTATFLRRYPKDIGLPGGAALVGFQQPDTGAVARTVQGKLRETVSVLDFGAVGDGVNDDAPAFRAARDAMVARGGGIIYVPEGVYRFDSIEAVNTLSINGTTISQNTCLALYEGISLVGAGSQNTKLRRASGGIAAIIIAIDYANAKVSGLEIEGVGSTVGNNVQHGIITNPLSSLDHILENVEFSDLYIHDVGSYGLGNSLQCRNVLVSNVRTARTGSDGVDWKLRAATGILGMVSENLRFENISVRDFGERVDTTASTGIGVRGAAIMDGISVYGATAIKSGIEFVAGIANASTGDFRLSASRSIITNWYVEGANAKDDNKGLRVFACEAVQVGPGLAKWCKVDTIPVTASPFGFLDSASFTGVTVIPAHGRDSFRAEAPRTSFVGCRVISDKVYFDARRDNLVAGQTVFNLPWATTTANAAPRIVLKNGAQLTETTDYVWGANSVTLTAAVLITDEIVVIFAPVRAYRLEADFCGVQACRQDQWVPNATSYASASNFATATAIANMWDNRRGVAEVNSSTIAGFTSTGPGADENLRFNSKGAGTIQIATGSNRIGFFGEAVGTTRPTVTGSRGGNAALASLLSALAAMGLITDSTS